MAMCTFILLVLLWRVHSVPAADLNTNKFPDSFIFGVATSSYQIEGAWNESDKTEDIWSYFTHNYPELIKDRSNGDVACDAYHHTDDDVALLKDLGVDFYRFSLSWTRLLPTSFDNKISRDGLAYYNNLIDALLAANITPMITIYHWDLPMPLQLLGAWNNIKMVDYTTDFARVAFENFGDRVKYWITFNEPYSFCNTDLRPAFSYEDGITNYLCIRCVLLAHASIYRLYNETFKLTQNGRCGITLSSSWYESNSTSVEDEAAADRMLQFMLGVYAHPIFSEVGGYPQSFKEAVANRSARQGFPYSRLPELTSDEIDYIKGTADFFGFNHYTTSMVVAAQERNITEVSSTSDLAANYFVQPDWNVTASSWFYSVPWGFTKILVWIKDQYNNPEIIITENGYSDLEGLEDEGRVNYFKEYLSAMLDAMDQGVNVVGYTAWSFMDNFEWHDGYTSRFGLYHVNFSDPRRTRTPKSSVRYYKQVIANKVLLPSSSDDDNNNNTGIIRTCSNVLISITVIMAVFNIRIFN